MPKFHEQLKRERLRRGWTQAQFARMLNIEEKTVRRWENRGQLPRPYLRPQICTLLEKSAEELGLFEKTTNTSSAAPAAETELFQGEEKPESLESVSKQIFGGEVPHLGNFYGREKELSTLERWIQDEQCRLIVVFGMGGIGKTALTTAFIKRLQPVFECIWWHSLQHAPSLTHLLEQFLQILRPSSQENHKHSLDEQMTLLIHELRQRRCLLVLDNAESLLQAEQSAGQRYLVGYEEYGTLLQRLGESRHKSCVLLTSREKLTQITHLEGKTTPVRSLHLMGIGYNEAKGLLSSKEITGTQEQWQRLTALYSGNPLALKLVAESIEGIFAGNIAHFLEFFEGEGMVFGGITDLLDQHFLRLPSREQEVLCWFALEREAISLETLLRNFVHPPSRAVLVETLDSLHHRSLLEMTAGARFSLQPVIMEYMTGRLIQQASKEFSREKEENADTWTKYAFLKAQSKDYIQDIQKRLVLYPLASQIERGATREQLKQTLMNMLEIQRQSGQRSYLAGNVLNVLIHLDYDLRGADFSSLMIRQAALRNVQLPAIDFSSAHFVDCSFSETFGTILSVRFSPDGKTLAAGTTAGHIRLYNVSDGTPLLTYQGHRDSVWSLT